MFLLAHVGITMAVGKAGVWVLERVQAGGRVEKAASPKTTHDKPAVSQPAFPRTIDFRFLLIGSILPDLIDKPLGMVILRTQLANGRVYAHTLLFALALLLAAVILPPRARPAAFSLFAGDIVHLILDSMWRNAQALLWPLYGFSFPHGTPMSVGGIVSSYFRMLLADRTIEATDALGLMLIVVILVSLLHGGRLRRLVSSGDL